MESTVYITPPSPPKHLHPMPLHNPPIRRIRHPARPPNPLPPHPHQPPRRRTPPPHPPRHQNPKPHPPSPPAPSPQDPAPCDAPHTAPTHSTPHPGRRGNATGCARPPAPASDRRTGCRTHTRRIVLRTPRGHARGTGDPSGVYSLTFLPLRGIGSSSPGEGASAAIRTASRTSRWIVGGKCSDRIRRAARDTSSAAQQIVDLLPEPARDPKALRFADAEVFPWSRGQL